MFKTTLVPIVKLTQLYAQVSRDCKFYDLTRKENDSEHSYQLAMTVWYVANTLQLSLEREKLLAYALVHDLVEIYAGDTAPFTHDQAYNQAISNTKAAREREAFERLSDGYEEFTELFARISAYEEKKDAESRFVYILDKMIADVNCFLSGERYYADRKYTHAQWLEWFDQKFTKLGELSEIEDKLLTGYKAFMLENTDFFFEE